LLTLVSRSEKLAGLEEQAQEWLTQYPQLVGVALNLNPQKTNAIFGPTTKCIAGRASVQEHFLGLTFQIQPTTFFQVFTERAEALLQVMLDHLNLQGHETVVDAYSGVGTITLPIAQRVQQVIGLEIQPEAIEQAEQNAALNQIQNVTFQTGAVETLLAELSIRPDLVILDPPRKGCDRRVIETLKALQPEKIAYMSCNPATLARDLKLLCEDQQYQLTTVQPADLFPQTAHVEAVAFLTLQAQGLEEIQVDS
jgi:23S rRNA (uracil1939-C5)-methyltransferase